jgi:hypothetical protein
LSIFRGLARQDPANTGWQRELAEAQLEQAAQSRAANGLDAARTQARAALASLEPLLARQPDDRPTLLATAAARLLLADTVESQNAPAAQRLRGHALNSLQAPDTGDPRVLALQVEALLALGREDAARPLVERLWKSGYRDPALLAVLQRSRIDYPVNAGLRGRLRMASRPTRLAATPSPSTQE